MGNPQTIPKINSLILVLLLIKLFKMSDSVQPFIDAIAAQVMESPALTNKILTAISEQLKAKKEAATTKETFLRGKEVDALLKISRPTRRKLVGDGLLVQYRAGGIILYRKDQVLNALTQMEAKRG